MRRLPTVNSRKLIKVLKKKGFIHDRTKGSHQIFINLEKQLTVSVPVHKGKDLGRGLTRQLLEDADISQEDFLKLV